MKKIIKGKLYNTETAMCLAEWWNGLSNSDFKHCSEALYRKNNGEYFLLGEGGPLSKYAEINDGGAWGDTKIIPYSEADARNWAEERLSADRYIELFGEPEE